MDHPISFGEPGVHHLKHPTPSGDVILYAADEDGIFDWRIVPPDAYWRAYEHLQELLNERADRAA